MQILLYDTTLRDGAQREGLSFSLADKLKIACELDAFGIHYIEGGWPGSNPKDADFFRAIRDVPLQHARITAFGSTRRPRKTCADDPNIAALVDAATPVVTLVGKSWTLHVEQVLETTREENLAMIGESVAYFKALDKEVCYDAEHFFDGYRADPDYALATLRAAADAGADVLVLCDTNGGTLPQHTSTIVAAVRSQLPQQQFGIHTHNDGALAVANALVAVEQGCVQVQGTINGYGERCGNMDLIPMIANLQLKLGYQCVPAEKLAGLARLSHQVAAIANLKPDDHAPYVGHSAFAHKGGIHVAAIEKVEASYQHIDPRVVGNQKRVVVSELSGRGNVRMRADELGLQMNGGERDVVRRIKELEHRGFQYEAAEGSFEVLVRRGHDGYTPPFELIDFTVIVEKRGENDVYSQATVRVRVGDQLMHMAADGDGPVNALDQAIRKALVPHYPLLSEIKLIDYKVRIVDEHLGTAATPRVVIESARGNETWSTMGASHNIIEASWLALWDSLELPLLRERDAHE